MKNTSDNIIVLKNINKKFGKFTALNDLDLVVRKGEIHGFLGPNGAGKSTAIRIILGLLRKTSGHAELFGEDPWKNAHSIHKRLAYVPGDVSLWPNLSGGESIDLLGNLRDGFSTKRKEELIQRFKLDPTKKNRTYSKGNRQKVAIIAALCADVELLILDEPTSGLDPLMERVFQEEILKEKQRGKTVLLSSHIMTEVEELADRVSVIRGGHVVRVGSLEEMQQDTSTHVTAHLKADPKELNDHEWIKDLSIDGQRINCRVEHAKVEDLMKLLTKLGIVTLVCEPPSLEELFLQHYSNEES